MITTSQRQAELDEFEHEFNGGLALPGEGVATRAVEASARTAVPPAVPGGDDASGENSDNASADPGSAPVARKPVDRKDAAK